MGRWGVQMDESAVKTLARATVCVQDSIRLLREVAQNKAAWAAQLVAERDRRSLPAAELVLVLVPDAPR